jgi:hypothetical protein
MAKDQEHYDFYIRFEELLTQLTPLQINMVMDFAEKLKKQQSQELFGAVLHLEKK